MDIYKVKKSDEGRKIKDFLIDFIGDQFTSSKIRKLIESGDIKVNSKKVVWNYLLKINDNINFYIKIKKNDFDFLKSKSELDVYYEDENIIIVNKPRGLICQKDKNEKFDTLNNRIKKYLYLKNENSFLDVHLVHRLDKYTFGLCVAGKNKEIIKLLNSSWLTNQVSKYYLCLCYGRFKKKSGTLINYIKENQNTNKMEIDTNNIFEKKIITHYWVINEFENYSKIKVKIDTGKKHQIRVHMSSISHPILGDTKYNNINNLNYKFPCLCSYKIVFNFDGKNKLNYLNKKNFELKKIKFK